MNTPRSITRSFAFKIALTMLSCIVLLFALNLLLNTFAFSEIYRNQQTAALTETYEQINQAAANPATLKQQLEQRTEHRDVSAFVWNERTVFHRDLGMTLPDSLNGSFPLLPTLKAENGQYTIRDLSRNEPSSASNTMLLYGKTDNGINVILEISLADMAASTAITNRFLWWSAAVTLIIGCFVLILLIRSFTKPLTKLSHMAENMADLNFEVRYEEHGQDELSQLGQNLNTVSQALEAALSDLKTANARLQNDIERSERQDEARRSFIRNVSHELKTPIALIQSYAEGLQDDIAQDEQQRKFYCRVIEEEASRLSQMISRMTMLMQLQSGSAQLQINRFDIRHLCEGLLSRYLPLFDERHIRLLPLPEQPAFVWGDAQLIENVMTNFITNAIHHTPENKTVQIGWQITEYQTLRITVSNEGSFIPEEEMSRIWESFYKIDQSHTRTYGGSGVGLSVVAAIMEAHQMPYGVNNTENGVRFYIELPLK